MKHYPALLCTTLFYKALLRATKYFSVQSTTFNITKHYKVLHNTSLYNKVSTTKWQSTTEHCSVLPPTNLFDSRNTWNVITLRGANSGRQNTKEHKHSRVIYLQHKRHHLHCAEQRESPSNITKTLRVPCKMKLQKMRENGWKVICSAQPIWEWSDHDPRMIRPWTRQSATRRKTETTFL